MTATLPRGVGAAVLRRLTPEPERELPRDPVAWVRDELDEHLWSKQREILRSVVEHRFTAVQSSHQIGKSYVAARLAAWWVAAHPRGEAMVLSTAPSGEQVRKILWGELTRAHQRGRLPGTISRGQVPEWVIDGVTVAFGRKPQDYTSPEQARTQFQGLHAKFLLLILDEAGGVPTWLWDACLTLITNEGSRLLAIGNPDDPTTHFAKVCAPGTTYNVIQVSAFDTPNFTGEQVPEDLRANLVSPLSVGEMEREWGVESPLYISKVLGEFPEVADSVIITPKMIREAHERDRSGHAIGDHGRYGMDVAREGADENAVYENRGGVIRWVDSWHSPDTDYSRERAEAILLRDRHAPWTIDLPGVGAAIYDPLAAKGYPVLAFNGGTAANDPNRFVNKNSEAWWAFREGLLAGLIDLDPKDLILAAQLQSRRWSLDASQRRIRIETKDEMKRRGIKSPDRADAAILSFYEGVRVPQNPLAMLASARESSITGDLLAMKT